ncbi:MAG: hypothetical protein FJ265_08630 [Planctomycetes bacterium]|nr:hypothetical protein [Planctomycetota bacterium]
MDTTIRPLAPGDLPAAAAFLERAVDAMPNVGPAELRATRAPVLLGRLRWLLLQNPAADPAAGLGDGLVDANGAIAGLHLVHPQPLRCGESPVRALCSSNFFVAPEARMQGYFLFRRFLKLPAAAHFATTCNRNSGALWQKLGGVAVPGSDAEALVVLRPGPLVEEALLRRGLGALARPANVLSRLAAPFLRRRGPRALRLRPCVDWDRLAALAARCRPADRLTADRTAAHLQWRFAATPARGDVEVFAVAGPAGEFGYVATLRGRRGRREQIRSRTLLDVVLPADVPFGGVLAALGEACRSDADLLAMAGWLAAQAQPGPRVLVRRFDAPQAFVAGRDAAGRPWAESAAFQPADGDSSR